MRLEEIEASIAAEQRLKRMKASAKAAKDRARQLKAEVEVAGNRLELQKAKRNLLQHNRSTAPGTIKPYH